MAYWLMKSEPDEVGIDHLAANPERAFEWTGVRNYQARNFMRDQMQPGDQLLFWHSSCPQPGIAGIAEVASAAHADSSQFDPASPYFDPKSSPSSRSLFVTQSLDASRSKLVTKGKEKKTTNRLHSPAAPSNLTSRAASMS